MGLRHKLHPLRRLQKGNFFPLPLNWNSRPLKTFRARGRNITPIANSFIHTFDNRSFCRMMSDNRGGDGGQLDPNKTSKKKMVVKKKKCLHHRNRRREQEREMKGEKAEMMMMMRKRKKKIFPSVNVVIIVLLLGLVQLGAYLSFLLCTPPLPVSRRKNKLSHVCLDRFTTTIGSYCRLF